MEKEKLNIKDWIIKFNNKEFKKKDFDTQVKAGWYDWFCSDKSLARKTKNIGNIIKKINNEILLNNYYIFFKNNCPMFGPTYDTFKICRIDNGEVLYSIDLNDKREDHKYEIYGNKNDFVSALFGTNNRKELIKFINNNKIEFLRKEEEIKE